MATYLDNGCITYTLSYIIEVCIEVTQKEYRNKEFSHACIFRNRLPQPNWIWHFQDQEVCGGVYGCVDVWGVWVVEVGIGMRVGVGVGIGVRVSVGVCVGVCVGVEVGVGVCNKICKSVTTIPGRRK